MKNEFYYRSADEKTRIHAIEWIPETEVKAVLQLCHGMVEYIDRYHEFADILALNGYYVVGHDHLGHGKSVTGADKLGYFHHPDGNDCLVSDIHQLRKRTEAKYPNVPYYILGHSMGSFLVRQYIGMYGVGLHGAIIMGTGDQANITLGAGKMICRLIALFRGWHCRSGFVDSMAVGAYEKAFKNETDGSNWLSRNPENVKKYRNDLMCGYMFTVNAYYHMFSGMMKMNRQEKAGNLSKKLPIYFVAGAEDPVGNFGVGVKKVCKRYRGMGMKDVTLKLFENDRHEILNELDREEVYEDIWRWMEIRRQL